MQTKLTLRLEDELIERAKQHAKQTGKSVSQIVADYFAYLDKDITVDEKTLPPITHSLSGVLEGANISEDDYYTYLEEKHL